MTKLQKTGRKQQYRTVLTNFEARVSQGLEKTASRSTRMTKGEKKNSPHRCLASSCSTSNAAHQVAARHLLQARMAQFQSLSGSFGTICRAPTGQPWGPGITCIKVAPSLQNQVSHASQRSCLPENSNSCACTTMKWTFLSSLAHSVCARERPMCGAREQAKSLPERGPEEGDPQLA